MRFHGSTQVYRGNHLNLKWTVADTDRILAWAKSRWTASEIAAAFTAEGKTTNVAQIMKICSDAGQTIRRGSVA